MVENVAENILKIRERISKAALKSGHKPEEIRLVAAIKKVPAKKVIEAINAGVVDLGENRVQDAVAKFNEVGDCVNWHFIGHLQRNKVKYIVPFVELIHSVDSIRLAREIDKQARKIGKVQKVLLEVNISHEKSKFGFFSDEISAKLKEIAKLKNVKVKGLMGIPPLTDKPENSRRFFKELKEIFDNIIKENVLCVEFSYLSMGMTNDFEVAIEEGANMVRIGTGIFGFREVVK
ncbi:YggS family pyridoxal phosphate-dependent enzyme [Candidatus Oleimmundimicrobium sp.]|uniref:YggS family pyridoxal phosphate-dependent enzyme n=1 Tax=Candidatus Oleimmundimicrobium sp. TaxID=3060597 RepID=UPI002727ACBF|nr:YggS family pyridoxal phosphate-dependent enzyme [Candidatus Oleimmundimicrobium sp.]MDO8885515.1 YggS family pyridoxal phosphate-dependent enzyme [Candidatus Oleimmundimicrobium sp.]